MKALLNKYRLDEVAAAFSYQFGQLPVSHPALWKQWSAPPRSMLTVLRRIYPLQRRFSCAPVAKVGEVVRLGQEFVRIALGNQGELWRIPVDVTEEVKNEYGKTESTVPAMPPETRSNLVLRSLMVR